MKRGERLALAGTEGVALVAIYVVLAAFTLYE